MPLHLAIEAVAPLAVVRLLLDANPLTERWTCVDLMRLRCVGEPSLRRKLISEPWQAMAVDDERRLLLHHAAICKASATVVELLLRLNPTASRRQDGAMSLPLHYAMMHDRPVLGAVEALVRVHAPDSEGP